MKNFILLSFFYLIPYAISAQEICDNLIDDDGDGLIDLLDEDCACSLTPGFNLITNGDFEDIVDCCATMMSGFPCVVDWVPLSGTADIYTPDCLTETVLEDNENFYEIGINSTILSMGTNDDFSESVGTCLEEKIIAGESYTFELDISFYNFLSSDTSGSFVLYGIPSCNDLIFDPTATICEKGIAFEKLVSIPLKEVFIPGWHSLAIGFIPTMDFEAIAIGTDCDGVGVDGVVPFIQLDNLSIIGNSTPWEYEDSIVVDGNVCDFIFYLEVQDSDTLSYQWFFNGQPIPGETDYRLQLNGQDPSVPGLYQVTIQGDNGCSITDDFLLEIPVIYESDSFFICPGDSVFAATKYWDQPGSYTINYLDTISPCQIQLDFFIEWYESYEFVTKDTICGGESIDFQGNIYDKAGTFTNYNKTENGCDSLYTLELFVRNEYFDTLNINICSGQTYSFNGEDLSISGEYEDESFSIHGCDSVTTLYLSVQDILIGDTLYVDLSDGETYNFNGTILDTTGIYVDTLISSFGCDSIAILNLTNSSPCAFTITSQSGISCEDNSGFIYLDVPEINETIEYSIDGGNTYDTSGVFENLVPASYNIIIISNACVVNFGFIDIPEPNILQADITSSQTISKGDSANINLSFLNFVPSSILWQSTAEISCDTCQFISSRPNETASYIAIVTDENGCEIILETSIIVRVDSDLYIPNIFTPNNDGINDYFNIYTKSGDNKIIKQLAIYDRWGNLIYEIINQPVKQFIGWDGQSNNRLVAQGVYAFYLSFEDEEVVIRGNITVMR